MKKMTQMKFKDLQMKIMLNFQNLYVKFSKKRFKILKLYEEFTL